MSRQYVSVAIVGMMILVSLSVMFTLTTTNSSAYIGTEGDLPQKLMYGSAAFDGDSTIYYFGGYNDTMADVGEIQAFNINNKTSWKASDFPPLTETVAVSLNGYIYVIGGLNEGSGSCNITR